jgi:Ala-tRNA(Pro) deacylase
MPENKLTAFLDAENVKYQVIEHPPAYTAQEIAASAHIPGRQLAKTVMVRLDALLAMVVISATERVNFERLQEHTGAKKVSLASEQEFKDKFPDCELGAMPPFGNLYGVPVYAAESLAGEIEIAFCGGAHGTLIRMAFDDFKRLAKPKMLDISWED